MQIQRGDTLSATASNHHTTVSALLHENPAITDPDSIMVGQGDQASVTRWRQHGVADVA